jgi:hypothetical protein
VRSQETNENQPSLNEAAPLIQQDGQDQECEQDKDDGQDQEMGNDKGGVEQDEDEGDKKESRSSPIFNPRVRQRIQCDHPVNNILGAIEKGATAQSHVAIFCEHYSFISYFEPFKVKDALQDLD